MQPRDQRRLTLAIFGVGILAVLISTGSRSGFWSGILPEPKPPVDNQQADAVSEALLGRAAQEAGEPTIVPNETEDRKPVDLKSMVDREAAARLERFKNRFAQPELEENERKLPPEMLRLIRDDTLGIPSTESEVYFAAIRMAEKVGQNRNTTYDEGDYAVFQETPDHCRGRVWKLRGQLRQLNRVPGDAALFGVSTVYDAWISLPESAGGLIHVHTISADPGLPIVASTGSNPPTVELTGIFFKRESYFRVGKDGNGALGSAPLILAGRLTHVVPKAASRGRADQLTPWLGWLLAIVGVGVFGALWQFRYSDKVFRHTRAHHWTSTAAVATFEGVEAVTIQESLRRLAEANTDVESLTERR